MFATPVGVLFLIITALYTETPLVEKTEAFLPWAFLFGLFISLMLMTTRSLIRQQFAPLSPTKWNLTFSLPIAFVGLLVSLLSFSSLQDWWARTVCLLFFIWIDAFLVDIHMMKVMCSFEGATRRMKHQLQRALLSKDLKKIISEFESMFMVFEEVFSKNNSHDIQACALFMKDCVDQILAAIPQITLPLGDKDGETLFDKYFIVQAVTAKKMEALTTVVKHAPTDFKWDVLIKLLSQMTTVFLPVQENFGAPFLLNLSELARLLQNNKSSKEMDVYAGCVEAAKAILDHCLQKKKNARKYVGPILISLEILMKERFRHDRSINPAYLMQPFAEIAEYLADSSFLPLAGREDLMSDLKRILSQFAILETVSGRMGEVHHTDTTSTYREDLPYTPPSEKDSGKDLEI